MYEVSEDEEEMLYQSNLIEHENSSTALESAKDAWTYAVYHRGDVMPQLIRDVHLLIMSRIDATVAGKFRKHDAYVGGYSGMKKMLDASKITLALVKLCKFIPRSEADVKSWHIAFESIHPFADGNGRTGRILMNIQRMNLELPLLIIHYGAEQNEYYSWFDMKRDFKYQSCTALSGQFCVKHQVVHREKTWFEKWDEVIRGNRDV